MSAQQYTPRHVVFYIEQDTPDIDAHFQHDVHSAVYELRLAVAKHEHNFGGEVIEDGRGNPVNPGDRAGVFRASNGLTIAWSAGGGEEVRPPWWKRLVQAITGVAPAILLLLMAAPAHASGFYMPCWAKFVLIGAGYLPELAIVFAITFVLFGVLKKIARPTTSWARWLLLDAVVTCATVVLVTVAIGLHYGACQ